MAFGWRMGLDWGLGCGQNYRGLGLGLWGLG